MPNTYSSAVAAPPESRKGCAPFATGTFIQSWLCEAWNDSQWDKEINDMKAVGINTFILGDTAYKKRKKAGGKWSTFYPSELPVLNGDTLEKCFGDVIEKSLRKCAEHSISVYIGMGSYDNWYFHGGNGNEFPEFCRISRDIAEELYHRYYDRYSSIIKGWYFAPEINNLRLLCIPHAGKIAQGVNIVLDKLTELNPSLPVLMSPYHTKYLGAGLKQTEAFWRKLFSQIHFRPGDIFCPQDAVGAGWIDITDLDGFMKVYDEVIREADKGVRFWANCEDFIQYNTGKLFGPPKSENTAYVTAPLSRFEKQMRIVSPYVENIITFAYSHYVSPQAVGSSVYYDTYLDYYKNHRVKSDKPSVPAKIETELRPDGLHIQWDAGTDTVGVAGYRLFKNGSFLVRRDVHSSVIDPENRPLCEYTDAAFRPKGETVYEVECFDGAGNNSERLSVTVSGSNPNTSAEK